MPIDVTASVVIARSTAAVSADVEDSEHDLLWIRALTSAKRLSVPPFGVGTRVERKAKMMGREMTYTTEVVRYEQGHIVEMETISGPVPMHVTYTLNVEGDGTRLSIRNQGGKGILFMLFGAFIGRMVNGRARGDLEALKSELERGS